MSKPRCIICYKNCSSEDGHRGEFGNSSETLSQFFQFLECHLDDDISLGGHGRYGSNQSPLQRLIQAGMLSCKECLKTVESFCEIYNKMKYLELQLNGQMRMLTEVMSHAGKVPTRFKKFWESVNQLEMDDISAADVLDFKMDLVKKCTRKLDKVEFAEVAVASKKSPGPGEFLSTCSQSFFNVEINDSASPEYKKTEDDDCNTETDSRPSGSNFASTSTSGKESTNSGDSQNPSNDQSQYSKQSEGSNDHLGSKKSKGSGRESHGKCPKPAVAEANVDMDELKTYFLDDADQDMETNKDTSLETEQPSGEHFLVPIFLTHKPTSSASITHVDNDDDDDDPSVNYRQSTPSKQPGSSKPVSIVPFKSNQRKDMVKSKTNPETGKKKCPKCTLEFNHAKALRRHFNTAHLKLRFQCTDCNKHFTRRDHYNRHYDNVHLGVKFQCQKCNKSFVRQDKLVQHQRTTTCGIDQ